MFKSHTITSISNTFNKVGIPLQYQGFKAEILTLHKCTYNVLLHVVRLFFKLN